VWWHTPVFTAVRKLRQEDHKFQASLGYIVSKTLSQKVKETNNNKQNSEDSPSLLSNWKKEINNLFFIMEGTSQQALDTPPLQNLAEMTSPSIFMRFTFCHLALCL
jgi:hypothetical protein